MARRARGYQVPRVLAEPPRTSASERFQPSAAITSATATPQPPLRVQPRPPLFAERHDPADEVLRTGRCTKRRREEHQQPERRISSLPLCRHDQHLSVAGPAPATRGNQGTVVAAADRFRPACGLGSGYGFDEISIAARTLSELLPGGLEDTAFAYAKARLCASAHPRGSGETRVSELARSRDRISAHRR